MTSAAAATELDRSNALNLKGFALIPDVLGGAEIDRLRSILDLDRAPARARRAGRTYGARNLLDLPQVRAVAAHPAVRALVEPLVGSEAIAVRALFFDKTPEANWPVLWHQDLTVAVAARHDRDGWGPWSIKAGVPHVLPPANLLAGMLTVRLHLDDCHADNGPLRVLPGSHTLGRLGREAIATLRAESPNHVVIAPLGSALLMRPLLVHASSPAARPSRRRVLHLEFARRDVLPPPLAWASERPCEAA